MTNINKAFKCANCSTDFPVSIATDLEISDFTMVSKCPKCGNAMQIHFGVIGQAQTPTQQQVQEALPQLDEGLFVPPEMPGDELRKLIGE